MRKMVSVPKLIIVMKPNLSAPVLRLSTGPPCYIILDRDYHRTAPGPRMTMQSRHICHWK